MNKKLKKALFVGALILGTTATFTACSQKNYDDDIANLQAQIDANLKKINEINTLVTSGSVISNTTATTNGVKITLSNGTSFDIVNGTNGKDGTVWTIGTDGYWYKDGTKTDYYALGKDGANGTNGKDGTNGTNGKDGTNGTNGKDGIYYVPNAKTGCFDIYNADGTLKESTTISFLAPGTITAVDDGADITLSGVSGITGSVVIAKTNHLRGLVLQPQLYVKGIAAIKYYSFNYKTQKYSGLNSQNESWVDDKDGTPINRIGTASYYVNPSNVNENYVNTNLSFITTDNVESRTSSSNLNVTPIYGGLSSPKEGIGILTVNVKVDGTPADGDQISMVALHINPKYSKSSTEDIEGVTSDYARIYKESLDNIAIGDTITNINRLTGNYAFQVPNGYFRYRTLMNDRDANAAISDIVWDASSTAANGCEYKVAYNSSIDLKQYAGAVYSSENTPLTSAEMTALNLKLTFEPVSNYKLGSGTETDQANFIKLDNGVATPQFEGNYSTACIGRTPIIRVKLWHGGELVKVAYIKIKICDKIRNSTYNKSLPLGTFELGCGNIQTVTLNPATDPTAKATAITEMNEVYNFFGYSNTEFTDKYDFAGVIEVGTKKIGTMGFIDDGTSTHTHLFTWTLSRSEILNHAGPISQTAKFVNKSDNSDILYIPISAEVKSDKAAFTDDYYQTNYWNADKSTCYINAAVPESGSVDATKCIIQTNLLTLFRNTGEIITSQDVIHFYFNATQHDDLTVTNENYVSTLKYEDETIATISADNIITYNKNSAKAKELLNSGNMYAYISANVYRCGETDREATITFKGDTKFKADFKQPVTIATTAGKSFTDGVDYGKEGSYIAIENLINPTDWRGYSFNADGNTNYWRYYDIQSITIDTANATCDLSGVTQKCSDAQLELTQTTSPWYGLNSPNGYGFLTYKNSGKIVNSPFKIKVKVNVVYTWGTIQSAEIAIKVSPTVGQ